MERPWLCSTGSIAELATAFSMTSPTATTLDADSSGFTTVVGVGAAAAALTAFGVGKVLTKSGLMLLQSSSVDGSEITQQLRSICEQELDGRSIDPDESLFDLGASSLKLIEIHEQWKDSGGVALEVPEAIRKQIERKLGPITCAEDLAAKVGAL